MFSSLGLSPHVQHKNTTGSILGFKGVEKEQRGNGIAGLELDCDILVPAALEKQITKDNADKVGCTCV